MSMLDFSGVSGVVPVHNEVLDAALAIAGYNAVAALALDIVGNEEGVAPGLKYALRLMSNHIGSLDGGNPSASTILDKIAKIKWSEVGIPDEELPALEAGERAGIIEVVLGVAKTVINGEATRLVALAEMDTSVPVEEPV